VATKNDLKTDLYLFFIRIC